MRLALITVSAIALSGCTWFGGGSQSGSFGFNGQSAAGCGAQAGFANGYNLQGYQGAQGFQGQGFPAVQGAGCGAAGGYGVGGGQFGQGQAGFGQGGFGQAGFGQGQAGFGQGGFGQAGFAGAQGVGATGFGLTGVSGGNVAQGPAFTAGFAEGFGAQTGAFGAQGLRGSFGQQGFAGQAGFGGQQVTTLGAAAPFGAAVAGQQFVGGQQFVNGGQFANVQQVVGQPIFVPQAFPVAAAAGFIAAASPFGFEGGIGTDIGVGGDISLLRDETTSNGFGLATEGDGSVDPSQTRVVSATPAISYNDAFDEAINYDATATFDVNRNTTLLGRFGYSEANGNTVPAGSAFEFASAPVDPTNIVVPAGGAAPVTASFSDLEQFTLEAGVRQYVGGFGNGFTGIRPYVGATAGAVRTNDVDVTFASDAFVSTGGVDPSIPILDGGWNPTASGVVGAEWQVGPVFAVGAEAGIRWQDNPTGLAGATEDRFSVPLRVRGRMSF